MSDLTAGEVLAAATANMVREDDVAGTLIRLLADSTALLGAEALAVLVRDEDGRLEILSSTCHDMEALEAYQVQQDEGPCVDCIRSGQPLHESGQHRLLSRWPRVAPVIIRAGYHTVLASPLSWHGCTFGTLNAFATSQAPLTTEQLRLAQAVADTASLLIMSSGQTDSHHVEQQIRSALAGRALVEQAKGAIAQRRSVDMATAYRELLTLAVEQGSSVKHAAERVMADAKNGHYR